MVAVFEAHDIPSSNALFLMNDTIQGACYFSVLELGFDVV